MAGKSCLLILLILFAQSDDAWASTSLVLSSCTLLEGDDLYPPTQREQQGGMAEPFDWSFALAAQVEPPAPAEPAAVEFRPAPCPSPRRTSLYVFMSLQR